MPAPLGDRKRQIWRKDSDGNDLMPNEMALYLEWLLDPMRVPATHKDYGADNNIPDRTLRQWRDDPRFRKEWAARAQEANISPERTQAVIDNMWRIAAKGEGNAAVKAGEVYLKFTELFTPTQKVIVKDDSVEKLSDAELYEMLERG